VAAQNSGPVRPPAKPRGKPFTGKDDPRRNNGGVPKVVREVRKLLSERGSKEAVDYLRKCVSGTAKDVHISMTGEVSNVPMGAKERITAAKTILEFGTAKPKEVIDLEMSGKDGEPIKTQTTVTYDLSKLTAEELIAWKALREKSRAGG
jgi:hypothetical protein